MKTPREENFAQFTSVNEMNQLNPEKLGYIFALTSESAQEDAQNVMDYAESPRELMQLLMGIVAVNFGIVDARMLQLMTMISTPQYDKLELFGKFPSKEDTIKIMEKFNEYVSDFELDSFEEAVGIALTNDEFNNWPTIIAICFGLIVSAAMTNKKVVNFS